MDFVQVTDEDGQDEEDIEDMIENGVDHDLVVESRMQDSRSKFITPCMLLMDPTRASTIVSGLHHLDSDAFLEARTLQRKKQHENHGFNGVKDLLRVVDPPLCSHGQTQGNLDPKVEKMLVGPCLTLVPGSSTLDQCICIGRGLHDGHAFVCHLFSFLVFLQNTYGPVVRLFGRALVFGVEDPKEGKKEL